MSSCELALPHVMQLDVLVIRGQHFLKVRRKPCLCISTKHYACFIAICHVATLFHISRDLLGALEISDDATSDTHDVSRCCTEVVVPCSRSSPHFVVLQQIRIDEHSQLSAVTKGRHAAVGLGNSMLHYRRMWRLFLTSH